MRDYAIVVSTFWTGATGREIRRHGRDATVLALYLMTCPNSNMIGLYYLPMPTLCHETGIPLQGASKGLASLSKGGFAHYDPPSEGVFVPEMAKYQISETVSTSDNRHKGIIREALRQRKSPFFADFWLKYQVPFNLPPIETLSPLQGAWKPLRSQDQDQEQDQDQDPPKPPKGAAADGFDEFWESWPAKIGKDAALKAWKKIQPDETTKREILQAVDQHKRCPRWLKEDGQFIPHASTWLNGKRWKDDVGDLFRANNACPTDAERIEAERLRKAKTDADLSGGMTPEEYRAYLDSKKDKKNE